MIFKFIEVVVCIFSLLNIFHIFHIIQSPIDGHVNYFQFEVVINTAIMNICAQIFVWA